MEGDNFKKTNSAASSLLSDPPATPEEIARSYTTTSDNAFQGFDQPGDQVDISKADQLTFNGQHSPVGGPMEEYYSDNHRLAQKHEAIRDSPKSRKRAKKDEWEISYVTQNPKSPLTTAPLKVGGNYFPIRLKRCLSRSSLFCHSKKLLTHLHRISRVTS